MPHTNRNPGQTTKESLPLLVLLPGFHGTAELFDAFRAEITFPCLPIGYPASPALGYAELATHVEARLPSNRPFYVLAESFSGPIAIAIASRHPDRCLGLILCASFAKDPVGLLGGWLPEPLRPLFAAAAGSSKLAPVRDWCLLGKFRTAELSNRLSAAIAHLTREVFCKRMQEALQADVTEALCESRCPILLIEAAHDRLLSKASAKHLRRIRPDAAAIRIEGPHLLLQTKPTAAAKAVAAWLETL